MNKKFSVLTLLIAATIIIFVFQSVHWQHYDAIQVPARSSWPSMTDLFSFSVSGDREHFETRILTFNKKVERVRKQLLPQDDSSWIEASFPNATTKFTVYREIDGDTYELLAKRLSVRIVVFPWIVRGEGDSLAWNSLNDTSNLLIQKYYTSNGDLQLCEYIEPKNVGNCSQIATELLQHVSLEPVYLMWRNTSLVSNASVISVFGQNYLATPSAIQRLLIFRDAIVTAVGDIFSGTFKYVPNACRPNYSGKLPARWLEAQVQREVFVISQFWGYGPFHAMLEVIPRVALFLDFLKSNPQIKILVPIFSDKLRQLLSILGISKSRLLSGVVRANLAYLPPTTSCGMARPPQTQLVSSRFREYIRSNFPAEPKNRLILIRRSVKRKFKQQKAIEKVVESAARDFNLTYEMFIDNPVPSLNDTMRMFHSAVMVVAPHGAGLSNVIFSPPGLFVVEGICAPPLANLCYRHTAHILGHHWYGISSKGCPAVVDANASSIEFTVRRLLQVYLASNDR